MKIYGNQIFCNNNQFNVNLKNYLTLSHAKKGFKQKFFKNKTNLQSGFSVILSSHMDPKVKIRITAAYIGLNAIALKQECLYYF